MVGLYEETGGKPRAYLVFIGYNRSVCELLVENCWYLCLWLIVHCVEDQSLYECTKDVHVYYGVHVTLSKAFQ